MEKETKESIENPVPAAARDNLLTDTQQAAASPNNASQQPLHTAEEATPAPKFNKGQRVFAKDMMSGLLYEATVRRTMHGVARQRQLHMHASMSQAEMDEFFQHEPEPSWHCFVHYLGWNVKWDRWVDETSLYEPSEGTRQLAKRLQEEVKAVKAKHRKSSKSSAGAKIWVELEQRMKRLEQERRMEERREELAKQGIVMEESEQQDEEEAKPVKKKQWTKASLTKELALRENCLQGPRKQILAEKLVLPFSLKKIMVDEWEVITQCGMLPNLPASVTVRQLLDKYLAAKFEMLDVKKQEEGEVLLTDSTAADTDAKVETTSSVETTENEPKDNRDDETSKKQQEWKDMVDGIAMLFDQSFANFLLYRQELPQFALVQEDEDLGSQPPSELYGCEHLLRFLIHLPGLLAGELSDVEMRPIFSKMKDLVLFLQKHQATLFAQSYHPVKEDDKPGRPGRKRRASSSGGSHNKRMREKNNAALPPTTRSVAVETTEAAAPSSENTVDETKS